MKQTPINDGLKRIQDVIARETGSPLQGDAERQLALILRDTAAATASSTGDEFLSREVTILLADLRGFTSISEAFPANVVLGVLSRYLESMSDIISRHGGTIDKFMGDAVMVLFGAPFTHGDDVMRAVTCAAEMQIAMEEINRNNREQGLPELFMGVGINTGIVMAGVLGSGIYSEYTVIGNDVNLASRIEAFSLRGQILVSEQTFVCCSGRVNASEPMEVYVKGKAEPVLLREIHSIPSLGLEVPRKESRRSPRVEVNLPFSYQLVSNKIVVPQKHRGTILDISYHGVLAELAEGLDARAELKLDLNLPLVGYAATDIYAKILRMRTGDQQCVAEIEFTSLGAKSDKNIHHLIHLLMQGSEAR